ncbi:MAG TPA: hypothetical protein DEA08_25015, partial [Planctomycetes bacterium]|nr:hypothetical protein [Planctomycetota bacterium]
MGAGLRLPAPAARPRARGVRGPSSDVLRSPDGAGLPRAGGSCSRKVPHPPAHLPAAVRPRRTSAQAGRVRARPGVHGGAAQGERAGGRAPRREEQDAGGGFLELLRGGHFRARVRALSGGLRSPRQGPVGEGPPRAPGRSGSPELRRTGAKSRRREGGLPQRAGAGQTPLPRGAARGRRHHLGGGRDTGRDRRRDPGALPVALAKVVLDVISGPLRGRRYVFSEPGRVTFGRAPSCGATQLPAGDSEVSRLHFALRIAPPRAVVVDLGSLRGTLVGD